MKKFLMLLSARESIPSNIKRCLEEQPARSGMYNWLFVHKGEISTYWEKQNNLEDYDVIQINMSPVDMHVIPMIREKLKNSSTKLVLNNDYVCEYWDKFNLDPYYYDHIQKMGDMVFGTEPHQVSNMINGTFCMPHPSNTKYLKAIGSDKEFDSVGGIFHWWDGKTYLMNRTLDMVKKKHNIKESHLYGYKQQDDYMIRYSKIMFDKKFPLMNFSDFAQTIQGEKVLFDPNCFHTYGRNGVELACWKKLVVGSNRVFSYNKLFPELAVDPYDNNAIMKSFDLALNGKVDDIISRAYEDVEFFNYKNSLARWNKNFDLAIERGGYEWNSKNN